MRLARPPSSCKVYTSPDLADAMVRSLGDQEHAVWLEPSHGKGAFLEALSRLGIEKDRVVAIDLDTSIAEADKLAITFRGLDFLRWASTTDRRFDRIVGNPPFIPISRLPASLRKTASSVLDANGKPIGSGTNVWCAFVIASLRLLRQGGSLAFVLPSAAGFSDYAEKIRKTVFQSFGNLELYHCTRPLFDEVQEGTLVALARDYGSGPCTMRRRRFTSRTALIRGLSRGSRVSGRKCPSKAQPRDKGVLPFNSVATIHLGGVTGHSDYFLMTESKRESLGLPFGAVSHVVSKAKHVRCAALTMANWRELREGGERIWLFNPLDSLVTSSSVKRYLKLDHKNGGCNCQAYKISIRKPWYRTPMPKIPDAFMSGMSQHGPFLCINETRCVNATNTLYVVRFLSRDRNDWFKWALALLTSYTQRQIRRLGRRYADGLIKFEPGTFRNIALPIMKANPEYKVLYDRAISAVFDGRIGTAREIADSLISSS